MSGITSYEQFMPPPNYTLAEELGFSVRVLGSYLGQLHLRKCLNKLHGLLYKVYQGTQDGPQLPTTGTAELFNGWIDPHLPWTGSHFKFEDTDAPAPDILTARLRAKYWGARVILSRAYIKTILDFNQQRRRRNLPPADAACFLNEYQSPKSDPVAKDILEGARRGIIAHVQSTRAFHGLNVKRFIITNPWGTAHA